MTIPMQRYDILIIDDNVDDYDLCVNILSKAVSSNAPSSFQVHHVTSGSEALVWLRERTPHCVLLDYSLPGIDGLTILNEIRKQNANLPIVIMTGQGNEKLAVELLKAGAQDYIVKSDLVTVGLPGLIHRLLLTNEKPKDHDESISIIVIDDNPDDREFVIRSLKKSSKATYCFFEVDSGKNILDVVNQQKPHCILLDYSLPGEDGLTVLKKMTSHYPTIPVIVISGQGSEVVAAQAIKNGAFHYLVKSDLSAHILESTITQGIEKKQLEQKLGEKNKQVKQYQYEAIKRKNLFDSVVKATNIMVWEYDVIEDRLFADETFLMLLDESIDVNTFTLSQFRRLVHPDDRKLVEQAWASYWVSKENNTDIIYRIKHKNGNWHWIREIGNIVAFNDEKPIKIAGLYESIDHKKREEEVVNQFYKLALDYSKSFEQRLIDVLSLGIDYLDMEYSTVSEITEQGYLVRYSAPLGALSVNDRLNFTNTYCERVFGSPEVQSWEETQPSQGHRMHPGIDHQALHSYIGTTLFLNGIPYGTLAFFKTELREKPLLTSDRNIVRLIGQWISSELVQQVNLRKIASSEQFLQLIENANPDFMFVKDDHFRIIRANPAFLNVYPESIRDSIIGTTTVESYNEKEAAEFLYQDKIALEKGQSEIEETILFPDGCTRTLHTKKIRFTDSENHLFILGIARDITERKENERRLFESEERYELSVKGSSVGLWDWNIKKGTLFWSDRFREIVGVSDADFIPEFESFSNRLHPDDKEKTTQAIVDHLEKKQPYDVEYRLKKDDNTYVWIHARGQAIWDENGTATRMAGSVDDITASKLAQEQLVRSNRELERFAYVASHDLQEPLRMVISFTQMLEKHYGEKLDDRAKQYINIASSSAERMQQLVRDLLDYARVGNQAETYEEVELNALVRSVEESLAGSIIQSGAVINVQPLPTVMAEPLHMYSVFQNLIGNAIKYRQPNVAPIISVTVEPSADYWVFSIADNGIGMKQQYCKKIFEPFKRLHRKEEYAGTGMGLSICRKSIEGMGGRIWVTSVLGVGSTFHFTLPKK